MVEQIKKEDLERFLRNVPTPVLLGIFGENCLPCEELDQAITERQLPTDVTFARVSLSNDPGDEGIADALAVEEFPTVIGFCQGEEIGRTSEVEELDGLLEKLRRCGGDK